MVTRKFVELVDIKNFFLTIMPYLIYFGEKMEFVIFTKTLFMDETRTVRKK